MRLKKLVFAAMCVTMLVSLSACGKSEEKETEVLTTAQVEETSGSTEATEPTDSASQVVEGSFSSFQTWDFEGNEVTEEIFADHDLTMINIWATFCNPCLREMPDLNAINEEYRDKNFQVVGIVIDLFNQDGTVSEEQFQLAVEIAVATGTEYTHLLPSVDLINIKLKDVSSVPETIFVDSEGNIVGESYLGSRSKEDWIKIIDKTLEEVQK